MPKYNELDKAQRTLVDTNIALALSESIAQSIEVPSNIANPAHIEELRNKYSSRISQLEKLRYEAYMKAQDAGINVDNPQEYINRIIGIVRKMNALNPNQPARSYQKSAPKTFFAATGTAH